MKPPLRSTGGKLERLGQSYVSIKTAFKVQRSSPPLAARDSNIGKEATRVGNLKPTGRKHPKVFA